MTRSARIAILAKAPIPGFAKTRLIPVLGARAAARLQRAFTRATLRVAVEAGLGEVVLWCAPDKRHHAFRALQRVTGIRCEDQPEGDLGERIHRACASGGSGRTPQPVLILGTDCPALRPHHLHAAAAALHSGVDAVFIPAEDGGYVLVGLQRPQPALFNAMTWGTASVMGETRRRAGSLGLHFCELPTLWDVDTAEDLRRMQRLRIRDGRHEEFDL
jgi:rSAM/selenodomain-associated transferase 1